MNFERFIAELKDQLTKPLPGELAQFKMAPYERVLKPASTLWRSYQNSKPSAVLCLFFPKNETPHFVLIKRNEYKGVHSRQISFPGGKRDNADDSFETTALRETEEEIGVSSGINIIGELTEIYIAPSGFLVHPFVGYMDNEPEFIANQKEVDKIITVPLQLLLDDRIVQRKKIKVSSSSLKLNYPYFSIFEHTVWGATAMMLSELKEIINTANIEN